jgi:hypothetical protein
MPPRMSCAPSFAARAPAPEIGNRAWVAALLAQVPVASGQHESGRSVSPGRR